MTKADERRQFRFRRHPCAKVEGNVRIAEKAGGLLQAVVERRQDFAPRTFTDFHHQAIGAALDADGRAGRRNRRQHSRGFQS